MYVNTAASEFRHYLETTATRSTAHSTTGYGHSLGRTFGVAVLMTLLPAVVVTAVSFPVVATLVATLGVSIGQANRYRSSERSRDDPGLRPTTEETASTARH